MLAIPLGTHMKRDANNMILKMTVFFIYITFCYRKITRHYRNFQENE